MRQYTAYEPPKFFSDNKFGPDVFKNQCLGKTGCIVVAKETAKRRRNTPAPSSSSNTRNTVAAVSQPRMDEKPQLCDCINCITCAVISRSALLLSDAGPGLTGVVREKRIWNPGKYA